MKRRCTCKTKYVILSIWAMLYFIFPVQALEYNITRMAVDSLKRPKSGPEKLKHIINFDPLDYLYPDRYVAKGDSFGSRFLDHFYLGFSSGFSQMIPRGYRTLKNAMSVGGIVGYDFNRLHGVRASFAHANFDLKDGNGTVKQWSVDLDYVFNLTNYLNGYDKRRIFHLSPTIGLGFMNSSFYEDRKTVFKGQFGVNLGIGLGRNARIFVEPYASALGDQADLSGPSNLSKYDIMYGVKAGFIANMDNTNDYYGSEVVYVRGFFYELAQGLTFYNSDDLAFLKTMGTGYKISVGKWFDPIVGLRISAMAKDFYWSYRSTAPTLARPSYDTRFKGSMIAGRLEGLVNPLNFFPYWRQVRHPFELNAAIGGEYGWMTKRIPDTKNGLKCNYVAFTGALTFLYNMDKETSFFIEPRIVLAHFREPYRNVDREAAFTETSASISAGVRVCALNRHERVRWPHYTFEQRLFSGIQVGGLKHMRSANTVGNFALNYSGNFYVGYHLASKVSLKAAIEYEVLNESRYSSYLVNFNGAQKQLTALWNYRFSFVNFKLSYMLNLSNIYQKYDLNRKFNLYAEAGALYTKSKSVNGQLYSKESEVGLNAHIKEGPEGWAPALLVGAIGQYRVTDRWSLIVEPEMHYYLKSDFIGGVTPKLFNDLILKVNVGCSYTF